MNIEQMLKELKRSKLYERSTEDMGSLDKELRGKRLEKALYDWLNETEIAEKEICKLIDGEIGKRDLMEINKSVKVKFRKIEDLIKVF